MNREDWMHEREWRIPAGGQDDISNYRYHSPGSVPGILVGSPDWEPDRVASETQTNHETGELYPSGDLVLPEAWLTAERWVWDVGTKTIQRLEPLKKVAAPWLP
ncbi:hypothetical protein [Streptomyces sp. NBC_00328]|uniref:hypothetical protein n=1 Tax=Streptomyces sp. NBC_00328 TaxID=2903646 RepID=UPI002E2C34A4|nr:hypothetical protein [Streptomyces sp. NBC_00328]